MAVGIYGGRKGNESQHACSGEEQREETETDQLHWSEPRAVW